MVPTDVDRSPAPRPSTSRVLIVEDNYDAATVLRMVLEIQGHEVAVAHEADEALEHARAFLPEVVLCDIGLPGGQSGYDVARRLREDPLFSGVYLVALSGFGMPEDVQEAESAGFDAHLVKPVNLEQLESVLARKS